MELRIAVIGAGLIGRKHISVVHDAGHTCDIIDPDPLAKDLLQHGEWHADLGDYLSRHKPDGAIVATPNQLHLPHGLACLDAGIPILIEKPLADNVINAQALVDRAKAVGAPLLVGHHRRHSPLIQAAKTKLSDGSLGSLVAVHGQFWLHKPTAYFDLPWRKEEGAGPVYINLIHDIDLLRHFCGEIIAVQAMESHSQRGFAVEDTCVVLLRFESGVLGTFTVSDTIAAPFSWELTAGENPAYPKTDMSCYVIGGTHGSLSVPDLRFWSHVGTPDWWTQINVQSLSYTANDPLKVQLSHFCRVIEGKDWPLVSGEEGLRNIKVLDAIKRAARQGGTVHLE